MSAELVIQPGRQFANEAEFLSSQPPYTIGLEVVSARPRFVRTPKGPYLIIDHHADVERRVTLSACHQAWDAANLGLVGSFRRGGEYHPRVVTRDCDQDVTLAHHIIARAEVIPTLENHEIDRIDELVRVEGMLDVFGGVPPGRITPRLRRVMEGIAWIFNPYTDYKASGELYANDPSRHHDVMWECSQRISQHIAGKGGSRELDLDFRPIGTVGPCAVVERIGAEALLGAVSGSENHSGHDAVILWQQRPDGRNQYTYYRKSVLVPFNITRLYSILNQTDTYRADESHGGSDNMGGSPLITGSAITPPEMLRILRQHPEVLQHRVTNGS